MVVKKPGAGIEIDSARVSLSDFLRPRARSRAGSRRTMLVYPAQPVFGRTAEVAPVAGVALIEPPGQKRFARLSSASTVPLRTLVDTTHGTVMLTSATGTGQQTQTGRSTAASSASPTRSRSAVRGGNVVGLTVLTLAGQRPTGCPTPTPSGSGSAVIARHRPTTRRLWGDGHGSFQTTGTNRLSDRARHEVADRGQLRGHARQGRPRSRQRARLPYAQDRSRQGRAQLPCALAPRVGTPDGDLFLAERCRDHQGSRAASTPRGHPTFNHLPLRGRLVGHRSPALVRLGLERRPRDRHQQREQRDSEPSQWKADQEPRRDHAVESRTLLWSACISMLQPDRSVLPRIGPAQVSRRHSRLLGFQLDTHSRCVMSPLLRSAPEQWGHRRCAKLMACWRG